MPGAGELRERITIRRQVNTKNPRTGGLERSWQTIATVAADVKPISSREALIGEVLRGVLHFELLIYFRDDVQLADQILWGSRELNVHAADDRDRRRHWLWIIASTQAPQGA